MKAYAFIFILLMISTCKAQTEYRMVGGPCEGCEAVFEDGDRGIN